jgi:hypothetical protein
MGIVLVKEYRVTMADGTHFFLYAEHDIETLDSTLRYCKSIKPTGRAGLGFDERPQTFDGVPDRNCIGETR